MLCALYGVPGRVSFNTVVPAGLRAGSASPRGSERRRPSSGRFRGLLLRRGFAALPARRLLRFVRPAAFARVLRVVSPLQRM